MLVSLGPFTCKYTFVVIHDLTVDCLLGADFLKKHGAVIDCKSGTLSLGPHAVPIHNILQDVNVPLQPNSPGEVSVLVRATQEIPGHAIQLIICQVKGSTSSFENCMEGLIEPTVSAQTLPSHLCVAQSLSTVTPDDKVILQIRNVSPGPIKVCKGMKLGEVIPIHRIQIDECNNDLQNTDQESRIPDVNLDTSSLSATEKTDLLNLLTEYSDAFAWAGADPG